MRVTIVASVTEQNTNKSEKTKAATTKSIPSLQRYPPHHTPSRFLLYSHTRKKQQHATADAYKAPSQNAASSQRKQLLHTLFDLYVLVHPTVRSRYPTYTLYINDKQQNVVSDTYRAFPSSPNYLLSSFALQRLQTTMADAATHTIERTMNHIQPVYAVVITPDNCYIFVGSRRDIIKTDRRTGEEVKRRENAHAGVWSLSTDGTIIVSCSYNCSPKVWNMDLELQQSLEGHQAGVWSVDISPDSTTIASGDREGKAKLWKKGKGRVE